MSHRQNDGKQGAPTVANLFAPRPVEETQEQFVTLLTGTGFRLESIFSHGRAGEPDCWYDQEDAEWVLLVRGTATLEFENRAMLDLRAGDFLLIPAHAKHRVEFCSTDALWLALHIHDGPSGGAG